MPRVPTEREIAEAAERLGLTPPLTPTEYKKVARAIQLAPQIEAEERAEEAVKAAPADFAASIADAHTHLLSAGVPEHAAALVVAAIAPDLWRKNQGAAHAPD
ncbi:hypothetical protein GS935_20325 [Rhodococcus hoagii]|nr:hypothetical protein [Prescottella equi]